MSKYEFNGPVCTGGNESMSGSVTLDIDKKEIIEKGRIELIGRAINLALKEIGSNLDIEFDNHSSTEKLFIKIERRNP